MKKSGSLPEAVAEPGAVGRGLLDIVVIVFVG
jgi:hypothetical protein